MHLRGATDTIDVVGANSLGAHNHRDSLAHYSMTDCQRASADHSIECSTQEQAATDRRASRTSSQFF